MATTTSKATPATGAAPAAADAAAAAPTALAPTVAADATALRNVALLTAWVTSPVLLPIPVSLQMLVLAVLVIHIASERAAVALLERQADTSEDKEERDVISGAAAYRFPLVASCALLGLFLAFKYMPASVVAVLIGIYGLSLGSLALSSVLSPILAAVPACPDWARATHSLFHDFVEVSAVDVVSVICSIPVAVLYARTKLWLANNILAVSLALSAIEMLALGDFKSGAVLLSGLFFYDIFWVFGSKRVFGANVMVTVAKKFDGPIKLLFPQGAGASVGRAPWRRCPSGSFPCSASGTLSSRGSLSPCCYGGTCVTRRRRPRRRARRRPMATRTHRSRRSPAHAHTTTRCSPGTLPAWSPPSSL
eukprot:TRINITY_DN2721_c0_g1_i2.p1 TRINITY_DN2721_c0_g1~~TRINITY_DN2721_c0_g1_i2.p1  ORF type:complete len:411 (-),score=99.23 TRINITY_DN2721_c0_g1_i2:356-1450(-)